MNNFSRKFAEGGISTWKTPQLNGAAAAAPEPEKSDEELRQEAYEKACKQGYEAGKQQGLEEISRRLQVLENFITSLSHPFADQNEELVEYLAQLSGRIAKSLVRRELRTTPETLMALVRDTVAALNAVEQEITIHLNPNNAKVIRELINDTGREQSWQIVDDPMISLNNCKVRCRDSIIDADLDARISMIITQFLGDERNGSRE
mgnify:CR=1 FL=1